MESSNGFNLLYKGPLVINAQESMTLVMVQLYVCLTRKKYNLIQPF